MEFKGISTALKDGCRLCAFRSDAGLRIIRLERTGHLNGYGEHLHIEDALAHANEDYLAGGRRYEEVYGKIYPRHPCGGHEITSLLDGWIRDGFGFIATWKNDEVIVEMQGINKYLFSYVKIGRGATLDDALNEAFNAKEIIRC